MLKKTIKYEDYNGIEREEDFYFDITRSELVEMEYGRYGGMVEFIEKMVREQDVVKITAMFKELLLKSYGEKSEDGRRFVKSEEISKGFSETPAYDEIFFELYGDADKMATFIKSILPKNMQGSSRVLED